MVMAHSWRTHRMGALYRGLGLVVVLVLCGCEDIDWDWERRAWTQTRRPIRPSRRRAPPEYASDRPRVRTDLPPEPDPARAADASSAETGAEIPGANAVGNREIAIAQKHHLKADSSLTLRPNKILIIFFLRSDIILREPSYATFESLLMSIRLDMTVSDFGRKCKFF